MVNFENEIGVQSLQEMDWKNLLRQIKNGTCVPFIGPDVCANVNSYPHKAQIAQTWAEEEQYPLEDRSDLARVAQYLAVQSVPSYPLDKLVDEYDRIELPNFSDKYEPHRVLADLPLPLYITTNYDNFMSLALTKLTVPRDTHSDFCRWKDAPDPNRDFHTPKQTHPLVFHLFGYTKVPWSLVLTEYDYLKFLVNISMHQALVPSVISGAIAEGSLLFIGYQFNDWDFRILIHTIASFLARNLGRAQISVVTPDRQQEAAIYLKQYFPSRNLRVYWGTCQEFVTELRNRWEKSNNDCSA